MKETITNFLKQTRKTVWQHPVEFFFILFFVGLGIYIFESKDESVLPALRYAPVLFILAYTLNLQTRNSRWRWLYFLSALSTVPLLYIKADFNSLVYPVTLITAQLIYLIHDRLQDNHSFIKKSMQYVWAWLSAGFLAGVSWLLAISVFYSVRYIFEIWDQGEQRFITYAASFLFIGVMPLLFLTFNTKEAEKGIPVKLFTLLINYVLSPALFVYATILYLYFFKIALSWSLPKGGVGYIVMSFVSAVFLLRGCQTFLSRRLYGLFFRNASWITLPTLVMFWVGTCYRLNQYGLTEARVYLVAAGIILNILVFFFMFRRTAHYLYVAAIAVGILVFITYIPGISAKDMERISQTARNNWPMKEEHTVSPEFVRLYNSRPISLKGFQTLSPISPFAEKGLRLTLKDEKIYLFDKKDNLLMEKNKDQWLAEQIQRAGLTPGDTLTNEVDPLFFQTELDSVLLIIKEIEVFRDVPGSPYTLSEVEGAYLLKKELSLPENNRNAHEKE